VGQRQYLEAVFKRWDTSAGKGWLSKNGFRQALIPIRVRARDSDIDEWFVQFGVPGGFLDSKAFIDAAVKRSVTSTATSLAVGAEGAPLTPTQKDALVKEFRSAVTRRGGMNGMASLSRAFRIYDSNANQLLNKREFMTGLQNFGLNLSAATAGELMSCFDLDSDGNLDITEFIRGIRGGMNEMRKALVLQAFAVLDRNGTGDVTIEDLRMCYNARMHPYVIDGRMTEAQVLDDFMSQWDSTKRDGIISKREFIEYYEGVSCAIDRDDYFELMIRNAWHMAGGEGMSENTSNSRVLVTMPDGSQRVVCINNDLGLDLKDVKEVNRRLRAQGEQGVYNGGGNNAQDMNNKDSKGKPSQYVPAFNDAKTRSAKIAATPAPAKGISQTQSRTSGSSQTLGKTSAPAKTRDPSKGFPGSFTSACVNEFRKIVFAHGGANGIRTLGSIFRHFDDNKNRLIGADELQSGMADYGVQLSNQDCQLLVLALDRSQRGGVSFDDFLLAMRGGMNERRLVLVRKAFTQLDKTGNGTVDIEDIKASFNASKHPDVIAGTKKADVVLNEFMSQWETVGSVDGKITEAEFIGYYQDVSASIDTDDYFELMMRNAWHQSGGEGQMANTSCLRVLVIFTDGSQKVVEIENDIGLDRNDARGIRTRLRNQGISNIAKIRLS